MDYLSLVTTTSFFVLLAGLDLDFARTFVGTSCSCGGPLHQANYLRKGFGFGLPAGAPDDARIRYSFCCGRDGCRKRMMPTSLRFLPREPYFTITFVLVSAFHHGLTKERLEEVQALYKVSRSTIERWLRWWRETFPTTEAWRGLRGMMLVPADALANNAPAFLLKAFEEPGRELMEVMRLMLESLARPR